MMLLRCSKCNFVEKGTTRIDESCSSCGNKGEARESFPGFGSFVYSRMLLDYLKDIDRHNVDIVAKLKSLLEITGKKAKELLDDLVEYKHDNIEDFLQYINSKINARDSQVISEVFILSSKWSASDQMRIFVILSDSYVECLLAGLIDETLLFLCADISPIERRSILESLKSRKDIFDCYKKLVGERFEDDVQLAGYCENMNLVREARNNFIHGQRPFVINRIIFEKALMLFRQSPLVFQELNNKYLMKKI